MSRMYGFDSFELCNNDVRLYITEEGGQMAPVVFFPESENPIQPYYISPWAEENRDNSIPVILQVLRGDFFCMPFGEHNTTEDYSYECHGPTANMSWNLKSSSNSSITIQMDFPDGKAHVESTYETKVGHSVLYLTNHVTDCNLCVPIGHHAILDASSCLLISSGPLRFCAVSSDSDSPYGNMEYRCMPGRRVFAGLEKAPSRLADYASFDMTVFPSREGYVDIVQAVNDPNVSPLGWSCAVCPKRGYLWFSVKKISDFPSTIFWMENKGRHSKPWNSRNVCIGIEDTMTCYASGAEVSCKPNDMTRFGVQTAYQFTGDNTLKIIEGVARIPANFAKVADVKFIGGKAIFTDINGQTVRTDVDVSFLD